MGTLCTLGTCLGTLGTCAEQAGLPRRVVRGLGRAFIYLSISLGLLFGS